MSEKETLLGKIGNKKAKIGVIGMGYVGLPIALRFCHVGFSVTGFDVDEKKVAVLTRGKSYIKHIPSKKIAQRRDEGIFSATTQFKELKKVDVIIIAVPTPLTDKREPDLSYIEKTVDTIAPYLRKGHAVCLESTTYPGTTRDVLLPRLAPAGLKAGTDYFLIYSPEREDPVNANFSTHTIPKVVSGLTPSCLTVGKAVYGAIIDQVISVSSTEAAEMTKLLENIFRSVNIALVNELKTLTDRMGIDIWEVIDAAATKPFGFMPFYPGPGLGGHCIPIDPFYLSWKAKEFEIPTRFIELAGEVNTAMPYWVVEKIREALNEKKKSLNGASILLIGMAYKKGVDDMRESPGLKIFTLLAEGGATVSYHDPFIPKITRTRNYRIKASSRPLTVKTVADADAVVILTDHDEIDYRLIVKNASVVIDTRNATGRLPGKKKNVRNA